MEGYLQKIPVSGINLPSPIGSFFFNIVQQPYLASVYSHNSLNSGMCSVTDQVIQYTLSWFYSTTLCSVLTAPKLGYIIYNIFLTIVLKNEIKIEN